MVLGLDLSFRFDRWYDGLPSSGRDAGRVHRCVVRPSAGRRETPDAVELDVERGILGDAWGSEQGLERDTQVSLINVHVLRSLADGDEARMPLSGDNLIVDLELSEANLPAGTRLEIGTAVLRVGSVPHRPCGQFVERFGERAAKRVARASRRGRRGRGVLCAVEKGGTIRVGDEIAVVRSPAEAGAQQRSVSPSV